jgi:hypothetical protein
MSMMESSIVKAINLPWWLSRASVTVLPDLIDAIQFRDTILCRGCFARCKEKLELSPLHSAEEFSIMWDMKIKRASNLRVRNTGTHVNFQRDNKIDDRF